MEFYASILSGEFHYWLEWNSIPQSKSALVSERQAANKMRRGTLNFLFLSLTLPAATPDGRADKMLQFVFVLIPSHAIQSENNIRLCFAN
jgi:hypothetical protein